MPEAVSSRLLVVGMVGLEEHVFVDNRAISDPSAPANSKQLARTIVDRQLLAGGSLYFVGIAAQLLGTEVVAVTNTGSGPDALELARLDPTHGLTVRYDPRRGGVHRFLSLWDVRTGDKELYCQAGESLTSLDIAAQHFGDVDRVLVFSEEDYEVYDAVLRHAGDGALTGLVPNQALLPHPLPFHELLGRADFLFINSTEALAYSGESNSRDTIEWFGTHSSKATVVVTLGQAGVLVIPPRGEVLRMTRAAQHLTGPVLGGGDMFATAFMCLAHDEDLENPRKLVSAAMEVTDQALLVIGRRLRFPVK